MTPCLHCGRAHRVARPSSCGESRREYKRAWMAAKRKREALNEVRVVLTAKEWAAVCAKRLADRALHREAHRRAGRYPHDSPRAHPVTAWRPEGHECAACGARIARREIVWLSTRGDFCSLPCVLAAPKPIS